MRSMSKIGEIQFATDKGPYKFIDLMRNSLRDSHIEFHGEMRSISVPVRTLGQKVLTTSKGEESITIKQWFTFTWEYALGHKEVSEKVLVIDVYFRDTSPFQGGYDITQVFKLSDNAKAQLRTEITEFLTKTFKGLKVPKYAQYKVLWG